MELCWTPEAIQDRDDIYDYIEADNPVAALDLDELFEEKAAFAPTALHRRHGWEAGAGGAVDRPSAVLQ